MRAVVGGQVKGLGNAHHSRCSHTLIRLPDNTNTSFAILQKHRTCWQGFKTCYINDSLASWFHSLVFVPQDLRHKQDLAYPHILTVLDGALPALRETHDCAVSGMQAAMQLQGLQWLAMYV